MNIEKSKNNYIDNKKFLSELITHKENVEIAKENNLPFPKLSEYIGEVFILLAENIARRGNFCNYTYIDEMKLDAIENCVRYCNNFDPEKSKNAFGFFTKYIWNSFLRSIETEKHQQYLKYKTAQKLMVNFIDEDDFLFDEDLVPPVELYENLSDYISDYEKSMIRKKEKIKEKKKGIDKFLSEE